MHGWRTNEPTAFFAAGQPLNAPPVTETFYVLDLAGNVLTDNVGNRLTWR